MKPILSRPVTRGATVNEWEPAEHHLTHDGQAAFHARMLARIKAAQQQKPANVRTLNRKERKA